MYICPACGAGLTFNPKSQMLECAYCNSKYKPEVVEDSDVKTSKAHTEKKIDFSDNARNDVYEAVSYRCTQCGAELLTNEETLATFCSYCGSSALIQKKGATYKKPDYIVPFSKTKEECEKAYKRMLSKCFFAPSDMKKNQHIEKIRGIYMPYWVYSYGKKGVQVDKGSKRSRRVGDYVYYKDYEITTNIDAKCNGIIHDASANFSDSLSESMGPFSIADRKDFSPKYLSGFYADSEDVNSDTYVVQCRDLAEKKMSGELGRDPVYSKYNSLPKVMMKVTNSELGLFPVYFLATKNRKGDRISYAVVNGQSGKVAAEVPIDFGKYLIFSMILAVVIFIILNMSLTITPGVVLGISIIFSIISLFVTYRQVNKIFERENRLNDKGIIAKEKKEYKKNMNVDNKNKISNSNKRKKAPFGMMMKKLGKSILAIIIAIVILILHPVSDVSYYLGTFIAIIMTILSFLDIIKDINMLTTRKLPHLDARGGDEDA